MVDGEVQEYSLSTCLHLRTYFCEHSFPVSIDEENFCRWADLSKDNDGNLFDHPFLQAVGMFIGELSCLWVFYITFIVGRRRNESLASGGSEAVASPFGFNWLVFLPASCCDILGTSTMYIGLNLTYPSSFQMLRGAVMIFTALLSVAFLGRRISKSMWVGMFLVVCGLVLVGVSDIVFNNKDSDSDINSIITGDLLIIMAQVIVAIQMVYEERVLSKHNVAPLQAVGLEGLFGFVVLGLLLIPFAFIPGVRPFFNGKHVEDVGDAFRQMSENYIIIIATVGNILSIAFFNFSGLSVTKEMSATTRMVLDSARTVVIWAVSLLVGWQPFTWQSFLVQLGGFTLLIIGMCVYNDIVFGPFLRKHGCLNNPEGEEFKSLVNDDFGINTSAISDRDAALRSSDDYTGYEGYTPVVVS